MIQVAIGTKAQYIKTAPLLRLMDAAGVPYRLIDTGQHARFARTLRDELSVREPDVLIGGDQDVSSIPQALSWAIGVGGRLWSRSRLQRGIFGGQDGICVVHGDTPSTLLMALMARRAGLRLAHLEAGLRSHRLLHPFPEEMIRIVVMRLSHLLFAPDHAAVLNLERMGVRGGIVATEGNTSLEALHHALGDQPVTSEGQVVVTMHRVENLHRAKRLDGFVEVILRIAHDNEVLFVTHEPTTTALVRRGLAARMASAGVTMVPLVSHIKFVRALASAPFVITDGGSIQEECALLGVPTLLWRKWSERPDGLDANVVLSRYDPTAMDRFLSDPGRYRRPMRVPKVAPSSQILDVLVDEADR